MFQQRGVYQILEERAIELMLLDLLMPDLSGEEILTSGQEPFPKYRSSW